MRKFDSVQRALPAPFDVIGETGNVPDYVRVNPPRCPLPYRLASESCMSWPDGESDPKPAITRLARGAIAMTNAGKTRDAITMTDPCPEEGSLGVGLSPK